jgi:putative nucleotidyltransferase with HDIG domain
MPPAEAPHAIAPAAARRQLYDKLFSRISEVSSLPTLAMRIFDVASDPNTDAEDLTRVLENDPALAARVVRTANSAFYGLKRKVPDLFSCVMLLGFKEVRNLALTVYVAGLFRETSGYGCYQRQGLWNHLVATAAVARFLCKRVRRREAEDAYLAGLLHDLGYILLDQYLHARFRNVIDQLNERTPTDEIEQSNLGFDHSELGARVAEKWRFPEILVTAIRYHHHTAECPGDERDILNSVALANYICHLKGITSLGMANCHCPPDSVFNELGIAKDELALLWTDIDDVVARAQAMALV